MYFHADVILDHASLTWFCVESSDLPRLAVVKVGARCVLVACLPRRCRIPAASVMLYCMHYVACRLLCTLCVAY